jgi:hypothetical protein
VRLERAESFSKNGCQRATISQNGVIFPESLLSDSCVQAPDQNDTRLPDRDDTALGISGGWLGVTVLLMSESRAAAACRGVTQFGPDILPPAAAEFVDINSHVRPMPTASAINPARPIVGPRLAELLRFGQSGADRWVARNSGSA